MMVKPIRALELHYPIIQFFIKHVTQIEEKSKLWSPLKKEMPWQVLAISFAVKIKNKQYFI